MRHRKAGRKFDTNAPHRKAMFRNMVTSLMRHGQIKTTLQRAKELRRVADKVITMGKRAPSLEEIESMTEGAQEARAARVAAIRRARNWVNDKEVLAKVFGEYAERYRSRPGGYTRVIRAGYRAGDNAEMAIIALVEPYDPEAQAVQDADEEATVAYDGTERIGTQQSDDSEASED